MSKITRFEKEFFPVFRKELDEALKPLAEKYGIAVKAGSATFSGTNSSIKIELAVLKEDGKPVSKESETFLMWAELLGMKKEDLNRVFKVGTKSYSLEGYMPRKAKFPFLAVNLDSGKQYCLPELAVKKALGYAT